MPPGPSRAVGLILAAGRSSRMRRFKPLLPIAGKPALARAVEAFRGAGIDCVVVIGHRADEVRPLLARLAVTVAVNRDYDSGMYSSVLAGLRSLDPRYEACLLLPADIPLIRPQTIRQIVEHSACGTAPVVYPVFEGRRGHPPAIARSVFPAIFEDHRGQGLAVVLQDFDAASVELPVFDEAVGLDMDTPDDYARLAAMAARTDRQDYPSRAECEAILAARQVPAPVRRHARKVAEVAVTLAGALSGRGRPLERDLLVAGGLLHDLAKGVPDHAAVGARLVEQMGFPAVAWVIASHMDLAGSEHELDEAAVVYLADKLVNGDTVVTLEQRKAGMSHRFSNDPDALKGASARLAAAGQVASLAERRMGRPLADVLAGCRGEGA